MSCDEAPYTCRVFLNKIHRSPLYVARRVYMHASLLGIVFYCTLLHRPLWSHLLVHRVVPASLCGRNGLHLRNRAPGRRCVIRQPISSSITTVGSEIETPELMAIKPRYTYNYIYHRVLCFVCCAIVYVNVGFDSENLRKPEYTRTRFVHAIVKWKDGLYVVFGLTCPHGYSLFQHRNLMRFICGDERGR